MKAFLFDLNGTMIHDMDYHTSAWQHVLQTELGAQFSWEELKPQMYGKNNEVLMRLFGPEKFSEPEMECLSIIKEARYQEEFLPHLQLLPGLAEFLKQANERGILLAIGSAAIPFNIDFVLDNLHIRHYFQAIVSADDVTLSKPHPETFLKAAEQLGVAPRECLVFEDVPKGAEAAQRAGMQTVILTTTHQVEEFTHLHNVVHFAPDFTDPFMQRLL
ncbi:haloacid dehalogenase superfamily, subfamily IA, variant 3 with third motif having DD or ED/beta-phosphoglucomutase family hydrolase [Hymenobacter gelipurpurascens]|uniref:Haloacid dehalogenase superfamily, subfamily IA, variant 3 with third motif having DD or ED/beta-phosphoglucomutase family hydrolase n=1 Tax=Hymenobacter gelipurpurascens TaxID=89968 RepID=A0A212T0F6_9BACT|nr:HAD family phosphatase [Hymenobacter gelipurpurascens]SNC59517.1 haloacid dehalogenase superfamily, subfamily IA, variant 3 with third motif having DD or ED/beta-phosphoglucomutase family hydrolase [Hymenobacter gelipurpurascens]